MASANHNSFKLYSHGDPQVIDMQEASGSANDWYISDLVKANGSGLAVIATAAKIAGIARKAATGTANTHFEVELIDPNAIYSIPASAGGSGIATAQANVGEAFDIDFTAGNMGVDTGNTTNQEVTIVGIHPDDAVGTTGGRYLVRFNYKCFAESGA